MKNLITYLKALWRRVADSQSTDVSIDCRLTVGSPSGLDAKWKQNPFMRFAVVLTLIFTIGSGNVWGMDSNYTIGSKVTSLVDGDYVAWGTANNNLAYVFESNWGKCNGTKSQWILFKVVKISDSFYLQNTADNKYMYSSATKKIALDASSKTAITLDASYRVYNSTAGTYALNSTGIRPYTSNKYTDAFLYKVNLLKVTYDGNGNTGGSVPTDNTNYLSSATVTVKSNSGSLAKTGYTFSGWNTKDDGSGTNYTAGTGTFTISNNITLYAKWVSAGTSVSLSKAATENGSFTLSSSNTGTPEINSVSTAGASGTVYVVGTPSTGYYVSNVTQSGASAAPTITEVSENVWSVVYGSSTTGTSTITVTFSPIWALKGDFDSWGDGYVMTGTGTVSVTRELTANTRYEFKIYNKATAYGNNGAIVHSISDWPFATDKSNCVLYTGPAGDYTFSINTSTKATSVAYPSVTHPNANYVYIKKGAGWSDARIYNYQSGSDSKMSDWGGSPILASCEICDETYYYGAAYFNKIIFRDGGSNQSNEVSLDRGKWLDETTHADSWSTFDKYTISYDKGTGTGGSMSSHTDLCPGSNQALSANAFTKDHYHFTGWVANVDVTINSATVTQGTLIADASTIQDIQSNITLTAQWAPNTYTITKTFSNVANAGLPASFTYTGATTTALNSTFTVDATNFFLPSSIAVTMGGTPLTQGTDYTYNNSTGAFTFSAVITGNIVITATATAKLKSIAITTQPTTRAYLVGDVFSSTGAVVTATMGDGNTKTVSATWTPSSALSAGTGQTVTASYTENGINQTATTTIDVYSVTVNKVNMSGAAITNASVTATCSGRTLSQSVGSTNYKFNSWNVTAGGVTVSTNTITGTPTGNVTINAKFHDPITVTWKVGSGAASGGTGEVKYGTAIAALPSTPADNALASCGTNKFMGWTALGELKGTGNDAPADLFTTVGGATALTENTTYRAVFASSTSGAAANTVLFEEPFTGMTADTKPTAPGSSATVYGSATITYTFTDGTGTSSGTTAIKNEALTYSGSAPEVMVGKKGTSSGAAGGKVVISGIPNGGASALTVSYTQNANGLSATASGTGYSGSTSGSSKTDKSFDVTVSSNADATLTLTFQATSTSNVRLDDIKVKVKTAGTTYADYQTGCCEAPGTALSITSANSVATGGTVSLTSTGGNGGTVTWSVVNGTGSATIEGATLTAGSVGTVTVKAHQDANTVLGTEYCAQDAEQAFTVVSSTINVTGVEVSPTSKAIVPGETFTITPTISPSNATDKSVSWTSSASDKATVTSGGVVEGVAAGTATITCTTTDGSYTATTAVTVYGVTMQALDEDGNAIGVGGPGAPSRTGASISPAADAGNYVFKEWAISGASLGSSASTKSNTITNPTGAVTVTAKYYKPRTVKWSVNGNDSYTAGGATTAVAYNGTISTVPTDPSGLACAGTFVAWTDAAHNNGQTAKDDDSYYGSALYTDAGDFPSITAETTTFYAVFAEGGEAAVNTTMWSENWTGVTSGKKPSEYDGTGRTVYNGGSVTYTESGSDCNVKAEYYAGGSSPELYIKGGEWWNIASIPTGGAATLTLTYMSNNDADVTTTTKNVAVGTTSSSGNSRSRTITISGDVSYFDLKFAKSSNTRVDNVLLKVASVSLTNYVTECDPNIVKVTYNANGGTTSCTNTTTDKTEDFTVCSTEPTRDYYTFAGWLCSADDEVYAASATIDDAVIDADFTLTAQWTPVPYSITYELDGGTNNVGNPATYNVTTATITLQDPTRDHDRFDGWFTDDGVWSDEVTEIPNGSHGNITLYAKWTERHEIVFDYTESASSGTTTIYRADDEDLSASVAGQGSVPSDPSAPTACSSKVFVGWSESPIDDETDDEPGDLMKPAAGTVDADKHYYAVWAIQSSTTGPVTVFEDALYGKAADGSTFSTYGDWDSFGYVYGCGTSTEGVRVSSKDNGGYLQLKANIGLASVDTIKFKIKSYGDTNGGKITLSSYSGAGTYDNGASAVFTTTNTSSWEEQTCILRSADNTTDIRFEGEGSKYRIYLKDIKITKAGTVYTYSAYSTSCCATKVTLSQNSPSNGTIVFGKTKVPTCGDKEVSLTITPAVGYQLHTYEVATGSGKVGTKSVSPAISLDNNSSAAQNITLTFADEANGAYDVTASFSKMAPTAWAWTYKSEAIPNPINLYVGQTATLNATYTPSGLLNSEQNYNVTKSANLTQTSKTYATPDIHYTFRADATMDDGTVTLTNQINSSLTITVHVHVDPLPLTHFEDLVHGKAFADVEATLVDNALSATKTTPTSDDWVTPNANSCEENHLHLVGWIREDWPALVAYLNGTGDAPATTAIVGAGNDGSGQAYFFAPNASINVQTFNDVTFYAVWAEIK